MAGKYDLTVEMAEEVCAGFQGFCEEITGELSSLGQKLTELCAACAYKPMNDETNAMIQYFYSEVRHKADETIEEWLEGSGSYTAGVRKMEAGDEAEDMAGGLEGKIRDIVNDFWSAGQFQEVSSNTSNPSVTGEQFDDYKNALGNTKEALEEKIESAVSKVNDRGEDSFTYSTIVPAYQAIGKSIESFMEHMAERIDKSKEIFGIKENEQRKSDEDAETTSGVAAVIDNIDDLQQMFNDFD